MRAKRPPHDDAFSRAAAQVPSCALDEQGLERQRERHRRLAPSVLQVRRIDEILVVDFARDFDRPALEELIAVERECCPFFTFSFDQHSGHLEVGVHDHGAASTLDAIADGLYGRTAED
jgi:hypothetical protein